MKKVSKKVQSTKLSKGKFLSLNGNVLEQVRGGKNASSVPTTAPSSDPPADTDRLCGSGCGNLSGW